MNLAHLPPKMIAAAIPIRGNEDFPGMSARRFCRRWFCFEDLTPDGTPKFSEEEIVKLESRLGYKSQCVNLLSKILGVKANTVAHWGVFFVDMPYNHRLTLHYADTIRIFFQYSCEHLPPDFLDRLYGYISGKPYGR